MTKRKAPKSWAEEIEELNDPAPQDFDPEEQLQISSDNQGSNSSSDDESQDNAREHYENVGKSTLRKPHPPSLGPQYKGSRISREELLATGNDEDHPSEDDIERSSSEYNESAAPDGEGLEQEVDDDENDFNEATVDDVARDDNNIEGLIAAASRSESDADSEKETDSILEDADSRSEPSSGVSTNTRSSTSPEAHNTPSSDDRTTLRKLMAESQNSVVATISAAAKADLAKGKAVKQQRSSFDALLNTRIRLQKSLIAANSLTFPSSLTTEPTPPHEPASQDSSSAIRAAEVTALDLWNRLDTLRHSLHPTHPPSLLTANSTTPTATLWTHLQSHSSHSTAHHRPSLEKWSAKLHPPAQLRPSLSTSAATKPTPLTTLLDQHLSPPNSTRLIARTRIPRSCAPLQASIRHAPADPQIYDDADFYALLLRDLVERRMGDTAAPAAAPPGTLLAMAAPKRRRRDVDTKASKGRKMSYAVHEKLRDFMVREDRGTWGEGRTRELFGGLLGRKVDRGVGEEGMEEAEGEEMDEEALMLFRR